MKTKTNDNVKALKTVLCAGALCVSFGLIASARNVEEYRADEECKALSVDILDDCAEYGLMTDGAAHTYDSLKACKRAPLEEYVRLVSKCADEAGFLDAVGGTDAWQEFCERVALSEEYKAYF